MAYRTTTCRQYDDGMVDCELEAAEALAGLAHSALSTASDASESPANSRSPPPPPPPHEQDHEILSPRHNIENPLPNILGSGNEFEICPSLTCSFDYPSVIGSKSRQNITEAEKEARRLRRVLANRESARQTIRRRQAMYEELTKKAADLALENENLKKEKELAAKEYDCLKSTNNSLKAQVTSVVKEEAQDIYEVSNSTQPEMSTAPSFFYNHSPMMPCIWRPMFQPLDAIHLQHGSQNGFSSNVGEPTPFLKQEHSTSNPATPFYRVIFNNSSQWSQYGTTSSILACER
ncbi:PREDICTED: bZIP transcription factor 68 isoform X6 [Ipomoea nil]|uniref:bZIP transcription factor 68 isoform X6 n=1 Tax=Ipomoea nil TaxID=35883 RepID=UPI000900C302|nr:PREDICTED: bZIP transcription factor 68 isoform X6 [Ipomoea nil]